MIQFTFLGKETMEKFGMAKEKTLAGLLSLNV
jgi:hypothetical protein